MTATKPVKAVKCIRCLNLQLTTAHQSFTCIRCGAQNRIGPETVLGVFRDISSAHKALVGLKTRAGKTCFK